MKILAIIPARAGSKRIKNKNIKNFGGKPLIEWTIDVAKINEQFCDILVSTNSEQVIEISRKKGVLAPWLRPEKLSDDMASSIDVVLHALNWYESNIQKVDAVMLLQPTSPFRTSKNINSAIELFEQNSMLGSLVSVSPSKSHPLWSCRLKNGFLVPYISDAKTVHRSQDLPESFVLNGSIYLCNPEYLRKNKVFFGPDTIPLIINSPKEGIDIDDEFDWKLAEHLFNEQINDGKT